MIAVKVLHRIGPLCIALLASCSVGFSQGVQSAQLDTAAVAELRPARSDSSSLRFATFNASLFRSKHGQLTDELQSGSEQAAHVAKILHTIDPDVFLLNEFDYDGGQSAQVFLDRYLNADEIKRPWTFHYCAEVNTGVDSGLDLDNDGKFSTPNDAWGYGTHPGQYGMLVISRFPIDTAAVRTFQKFRWKLMPVAEIPVLLNGESYYSEEAWASLRLSSKSHWDVPISIEGRTIHFVVAHPTPPVFDGPEDRNGKRNHDEIRLLRDYVCSDHDGYYIFDDNENFGPLSEDALFVVAGDQNADPADGDGSHEIIQSLLRSPAVNATQTPASLGAVEAAETQQGKNLEHVGESQYDTCDFNDQSVGNLRCDYLLPSAKLEISQCGVFWPRTQDLPKGQEKLLDVSDHRLVWADLLLPNP